MCCFLVVQAAGLEKALSDPHLVATIFIPVRSRSCLIHEGHDAVSARVDSGVNHCFCVQTDKAFKAAGAVPPELLLPILQYHVRALTLEHALACAPKRSLLRPHTPSRAGGSLAAQVVPGRVISSRRLLFAGKLYTLLQPKFLYAAITKKWWRLRIVGETNNVGIVKANLYTKKASAAQFAVVLFQHACASRSPRPWSLLITGHRAHCGRCARPQVPRPSAQGVPPSSPASSPSPCHHLPSPSLPPSSRCRGLQDRLW